MTYRSIQSSRLLRKHDICFKRFNYRYDWTTQVVVRVPPIDGRAFFNEYRLHGYQSGDGWHGEIGGACPVQGTGECDGTSWYFRARGERWSIEFGVGEDDSGELTGDILFERSGTHGPWPMAGWMGAKHAWSLIKRSIAEFRRSRIQ